MARQSDLGERIVALREERALTQAELAEKAGISPSTLSLIESGKIDRPHMSTLRKISRALGIDPQELRRPREFASSKSEAPLFSIPEIRERLEELGAQWGVVTDEMFLGYVRGLDPNIDESGNPNGIITAQRKLAEEADVLLTTTLSKPEVRRSLTELLPVDSGLSRSDLVHERARKFRKLKRELRRLYNARLVALANYTNALAEEEEAAGRSPGYLVPRRTAYEQIVEGALEQLEQELTRAEVS